MINHGIIYAFIRNTKYYFVLYLNVIYRIKRVFSIFEFKIVHGPTHLALDAWSLAGYTCPRVNNILEGDGYYPCSLNEWGNMTLAFSHSWEYITKVGYFFMVDKNNMIICPEPKIDFAYYYHLI